MPKIEKGAEIAWTLERIEATRVFCCALMVAAVFEFISHSDRSANWVYLAFAALGMVVTLQPKRWTAILAFAIVILGPGISIVRRVVETVDILGIKEARLEQQALFTAGSAVFVVVVLNAIVGSWFLIRAARRYSSLLREPLSYISFFRLPPGTQGLGRGRSALIVLLLLSAAIVSIGLAGILDWTLAFHRAFAAEVRIRLACFGNVDLFGGQAATEALELCRKKGRFPFLWSVLGATLLPAAFLLCGLRVRALARRRYVTGASELMKIDSRPPIIFLRPFSDDRIALSGPPQVWRRLLWWGQTYSTLDELLVLECSQHGPVVAIGRPGERVNTFGVSRVFTRDQEWRKIVEELCQSSRAVVLVGGMTSSLEYELELIARSEIAAKTIILAPPSAYAPRENGILWRWVAVKTAGKFATQNGETVIAVRTENSKPSALSSRDFSSIDYVVALRWFFERFDHAPDSGEKAPVERAGRRPLPDHRSGRRAVSHPPLLGCYSNLSSAVGSHVDR